jgi:hypothetical protein
MAGRKPAFPHFAVVVGSKKSPERRLEAREIGASSRTWCAGVSTRIEAGLTPEQWRRLPECAWMRGATAFAVPDSD